MIDDQHLPNDFHQSGKVHKRSLKVMRVWTQNENNFENFQEIVDIFDQISMEN